MTSSMLEQVRETALSATPWVITDKGVELYGWVIINPNAVTVYVKVFATAEPEVGTTTPLTIIPAPANEGYSAILLVKVARNGGTFGNNNEIAIRYVDCHVPIDRFGSVQEYHD